MVKVVAKLMASRGGRNSLAEVPPLASSNPQEQPCTSGLQCGATPTESTAPLCLLDQEGGEDSQGPRPHSTGLPPPALHHLIQGTTRGRHVHKCYQLLPQTLAANRKWSSTQGEVWSRVERLRGTNTRGWRRDANSPTAREAPPSSIQTQG